ncbi:MAG: glycosyltransferase family 2 protein, partial [Candidatus Levyibacteriota bacterium]
MKKPLLSIIILNYKTPKLTLASVISIEKNYPAEVKNGDFEIIIADNNSLDDSLKSFESYKKSSGITLFHIVANKENYGFAKGNNKGLVKATGQYVLFLNSDTVVYP